GVVVEERFELTAAMQRLAGCDRAMRAAFDLGQCRRVMRVDLQPGQVDRRDRLRDALESFGLEIEVDVEMDAELGPDSCTDRCQLFRYAAYQPVVPVPFGPTRRAAEARPVRG